MPVNLLAIGDYIRENYNDGRQQRKQSELSKIFSQAYGAPRDQRGDLVSKAMAIDADAGFKLGKGLGEWDDRHLESIGREAAYFSALPEEQKAATYPAFAAKVRAQTGLPVPETYHPEMNTALSKIAEVYGNRGAGTPNELKTFQAMTQGLDKSDIARARRIQLGLDPRAVTGATKFGEFTDSMGRTRPQRNNPSTGSVEIYYDESGQWVPLGGPQQAALPPLASNGANYGQASPVDPQIAEIERELGRKLTQEDFRQIAAGTWQAQAPARVPGLGVSRTPEQQAYLTTAAEQQAKLGSLPQQLAIETQDAVNRAGGVTSAQEAAKREGEIAGREQKRTRDANETLVLLDEAEKLLPSATSGGLQAMRDRGAGFAGISTKGAQSTASLNLIASKLVAAVPRFEGPQSNIDVQFYREAAGDLANPQLPVGTRMSALKTMRTLQQKYASHGASDGATKRRLKYNPATGKIE